MKFIVESDSKLCTKDKTYIKLRMRAEIYRPPGPSRATAGPGKTLSRGPINPSFCMSWDRDAKGVEREETWGEVSPYHPTRGSGSVVSSPSGVRGGAPAENGFYAYFRSERSHLEHHFQYLWATAGPPKRRGARENFPPFPPPLDGPASLLYIRQHKSCHFPSTAEHVNALLSGDL